MSKISLKRLRRAKKKAAAGKQVRPVAAGPGGDATWGARALRGAWNAFNNIRSGTSTNNLDELLSANHPAAMAAMRGFGRRRRMRVTNVKALHRAIRRVEGFGKLARKVIHFTHPHQKGRMTFRHRRKRRVA